MTAVKPGSVVLLVQDLVIIEGVENTWAWRWGTKIDALPETPTIYPDLTAWTARAQFRPRFGGDVWYEATTENAGIALTADGHIYLTIPQIETETAAWQSPARTEGLWDIELLDAGVAKRAIQGAFTISKNATR